MSSFFVNLTVSTWWLLQQGHMILGLLVKTPALTVLIGKVQQRGGCHTPVATATGVCCLSVCPWP